MRGHIRLTPKGAQAASLQMATKLVALHFRRRLLHASTCYEKDPG